MRSERKTITVRVPSVLDIDINVHVAKQGITKQDWITRTLRRGLPKPKETK